MAYNVNYQDAGENISPHITTSAEYDNAISGFISVSADYENSIRRMELTIIQKAMNLLVSDEDGTPQECSVKITSDGYADINETTDSDGWLSTDCPPVGVLEISCPGKITQTHDYDTDLLAGGVLQYTLVSSRNIEIYATLINRSPLSGVTASFFDVSGNYLSGSTTDAQGYCSIEANENGYLMLTKSGFQTQKHNYSINDTGIIMDLTMLATAEIVGNKNGYSVSLSPNNPQGTDYF